MISTLLSVFCGFAAVACGADSLINPVSMHVPATPPPDCISVKNPRYGARGGVRELADANIARGSATLVSETAAFTAADVGKTVEVTGAGSSGTRLIATISAVTKPTAAILDSQAETTVNRASLIIARDDFLPIKRAVAFAARSGQPICFPADTYYTHSGWVIGNPIRIYGGGSRILFSIWGAWETSEGFQIESPTRLALPFHGTLTAGATSLTLSSAAGLRASQRVMLVLGTDPWNKTQPYSSMFNTIAGVAGNTVTLTDPIPENIAGSSNSLIVFNSIAEDISIQDLTFDTPRASANMVDMPIYLRRARNVHISNIQMDYVPNGIGVLNSAGVSIENVCLKNVVGNNASINLIGSRNVSIRDVWVRNSAAPVGIRMETENRGVSLRNIFFGSQERSRTVVGIQAVGNSTGVTIENYHFNVAPENAQITIPLQIGENSEVQSRDLYLGKMPPVSFQDLTSHSGTLEYEGKSYKVLRSEKKRIALSPNMRDSEIPVPAGITKGITFFIKDKAGLRAIKALCGGGCSERFANDLTPGLPPSGVRGRLSGVNWVGVVGPQFPFNEASAPFGLEGKTIRVTTGPDIPPGDYLSMEIEYYPVEASAAEWYYWVVRHLRWRELL